LTDLQNHLAELRRKQAAIGDRITAALIAGEDTGPIRATDAALARDITALERRIADAGAQREAASQDAISAAAAMIAGDTENAVLATMARLAAPTIRNKGNEMTDVIKAAAYQVAELEAASNAAADELAAAHRHADSIRDRKAALVAERDAIAATRRAGGDADGARLALLGVDIEGLDGILAEATAACAAAQGKADQARTAVNAARQQLELVKDRELLSRLGPHATALAFKLADTMNEIRAAETRLKSRPSWAPPRAFCTEIRKLDLVADGIPGLRQ
jgi:hypothetical protein